jgi:hypothetical protein
MVERLLGRAVVRYMVGDLEECKRLAKKAEDLGGPLVASVMEMLRAKGEMA